MPQQGAQVAWELWTYMDWHSFCIFTQVMKKKWKGGAAQVASQQTGSKAELLREGIGMRQSQKRLLLHLCWGGDPCPGLELPWLGGKDPARPCLPKAPLHGAAHLQCGTIKPLAKMWSRSSPNYSETLKKCQGFVISGQQTLLIDSKEEFEILHYTPDLTGLNRMMKPIEFISY